MKLFKLIILIFPLLFIDLFWGTVFWGGHQEMIPSILISCFIAMILIYNKWYPEVPLPKYIALFVLPFVTLLLIMALFFGALWRATLIYIVFLPITGVLAYAYFKGYKISSTLGVVALAVIGYTQFFNVSVYFHPPKTEKAKMPELTFYNEEETVLELPKDNIVVLDFWISTCSVCFSKFPQLEELKKEYAENERVQIYSVGVKTQRESLSDLIHISDSLRYDYQTLYIKSIEDVKNKLNINGYPHLLILKNDTIRYDGYPYFEKYVTIGVYNNINRLLEE